MRSSLLAAVTVLLTACSGGDKSDSGNAGAAEAFAPTAGQWSWNGTQYDMDECNFAETFPAEIVDVTLWDLVLTDEGFTLDNELWTDEPIQCALTGMDASCTMVLVIEEEEWPEGSTNTGDPDATYTANGLMTGTFADSESGTISLTADITCEGADCDAYGAESGLVAPCTTALSGGFGLSN